MSLDATGHEGTVATKPLFSMALYLFINALCGSGGYVDVEVTDAWGEPWEGYSRKHCQTFTRDRVRHPVQWSGRDAVDLEPRGVKLKSHLRHAELYGFQFAYA